LFPLPSLNKSNFTSVPEDAERKLSGTKPDDFATDRVSAHGFFLWGDKLPKYKYDGFSYTNRSRVVSQEPRKLSPLLLNNIVLTATIPQLDQGYWWWMTPAENNKSPA
jgi:hypothetical protein